MLKNRKIRPIFIIGLLSVCYHSVSHGDGSPRGRLQVELVNDALFQTDRDYTGGLFIRWSPTGKPYTLRFGQEIYTPDHLGRSKPYNNEHPYAGWSYLGVNYSYPLSDRWLIDITIDAGTVGPRSGARLTQKFLHWVVSSSPPQGWDSQIYNEWGVMPELKMDYRLSQGEFGGAHYRLVPYLRWKTGNIIRDYGAGFRLLLGSALPAFSVLSLPQETEHYWYLQAGFEHKTVQRNVLMEGNSKVRGGVKIFSYGVTPEKELTLANLGAFFGRGAYEFGFNIRYNTKLYTVQGHPDEGFLSHNSAPMGNFVMSLIVTKQM
ncbi:lipid A-modifier LpxR family protein [uncultured Microbulbifer sp.]|uniref:lipid A-modifier LpxR family protein n=1 Tax=uncultured Microbulbifer sp. TaxID=348147 RepID=UPI003450DC0E